MIKILSHRTKTTVDNKHKRVFVQHVIYQDEPHPKSLASLILLKRDCEMSDMDYLLSQSTGIYGSNPANVHRAKRILFSRQYLHNVLDEKGCLECTYCRKRNLIIEEEGMKISNKTKATIDHVVPISLGGAVFDVENVLVACGTCNRRKRNHSLEFFLKICAHILNPNYEILNKWLKNGKQEIKAAM
jgi:hypothetical protein